MLKNAIFTGTILSVFLKAIAQVVRIEIGTSLKNRARLVIPNKLTAA